MKISAVQFNIAWEDKQRNFEKVNELIRRSNVEQNSLYVLPELFATGFSMNISKVVDSKNSETINFLQQLAHSYKIFIVAGVARLARKDMGQNQAIVIDPSGNEIAIYNKIHLFSLADEDRHYIAGKEIVNFNWNGFNVCPFICYDLRFPEIFRLAIKKYSTNLFLVIANWPASRDQHWRTLLKARAIENQSYVIGVNRIGTDVNCQYIGSSMIVDPLGNELAQADDRECVIHADIDVQTVISWRKKFPALIDIKSDYC